MALIDFPDGETCYIDTNIFYYHLVTTPFVSEDCSDFLKLVELGRVRAITSSVAVAEATHKVMLAEVVQRHGVDHKGLVSRIKRHPHLLDGLTAHKAVSDSVRSLRIGLETIGLDSIARAVDLSSQHRLLTNDALALAVMEKTGVMRIATNDDDFDRVGSITVFKPRRA